jgi:predicted SAM-dependent methyltransferase
LKLHLGCGRSYLEGYINIDFPPADHTVQADLVADRYEDITGLSYPNSSIDEIRLHHVFEHFSRPVALALLCRWRDWLKPGGLLRIETPDAAACFMLMKSPFYSFDSKQQVMRHLFGSHEAAWAVHADGWHKEKFKNTLNKLGFEKMKFVTNRWGVLRNIEVIAQREQREFTAEEYHSAVYGLLQVSTVRVRTKNKKIPEGSELQMLDVWVKLWKDAYEINEAHP